MVPDIALRLSATLKALEDVITPAISQEADLAREQLELVKRSIALVIDQLPFEYAYLAQDANADRALARELASFFPPGHAMQAELLDAVRDSENTLPLATRDARDLARCWRSLKSVLEEAVSALAKDMGTSGSSALTEVILRYSETRNVRERAWIAATGFDPDPESLPGIAEAALGLGSAS